MNNDKLGIFEYLYQECKDAFLDEWRRKQSLENTAKIYLSIYTIILGLGFIRTDATIQLFKEMAYKSSIICWVALASYFLFLYSIIRGLWMTVRAIQPGEYRTFPEPGKLLVVMKDKSELIYLKSLSKDFAKSTRVNEGENNKKAKALCFSYNFIKGAIISIAIIIVSIIVLKIKGG